MRAALVRIAGPLYQRKAPVVKNLPESRQPRMQTERHVRFVGADLQHVGSRNGERRPAAVIKRIVVRNQHAQRVVPAAEIQDDQVARMSTLCSSEVAQELRSREGDG